MKNCFVILAIAFILTVDIYGDNNKKKRTFTTIEAWDSYHKERKDYIIYNEEQWKNLWEQIHSSEEHKPKLPKINFTEEIVIAVFMGECSSGDHDIMITEIIENQDSIQIIVRETGPEPGSAQITVMSCPYHIIKTSISKKKFIFKREDKK